MTEHLIQANPVTTIATAGAAVALAGSGHMPTHQIDPDEESFALREDMRRIQAVMMARMAATGYQPAMAMASQPVRR